MLGRRGERNGIGLPLTCEQLELFAMIIATVVQPKLHSCATEPNRNFRI